MSTENCLRSFPVNEMTMQRFRFFLDYLDPSLNGKISPAPSTFPSVHWFMGQYLEGDNSQAEGAAVPWSLPDYRDMGKAAETEARKRSKGASNPRRWGNSEERRNSGKP